MEPYEKEMFEMVRPPMKMGKYPEENQQKQTSNKNMEMKDFDFDENPPFTASPIENRTKKMKPRFSYNPKSLLFASLFALAGVSLLGFAFMVIYMWNTFDATMQQMLLNEKKQEIYSEKNVKLIEKVLEQNTLSTESTQNSLGQISQSQQDQVKLLQNLEAQIKMLKDDMMNMELKVRDQMKVNSSEIQRLIQQKIDAKKVKK